MKSPRITSTRRRWGLMPCGMQELKLEKWQLQCLFNQPRCQTILMLPLALSRRPNFNPTAMHTDTWPCKSVCWDLLFGCSLTGRLGSFHFLQRIAKTSRKKHINCFRALNLPLDVMCFHNQLDCKDPLHVLKDGSHSGAKLSDNDILELKLTKCFRQ